jgi:hypothetical protein
VSTNREGARFVAGACALSVAAALLAVGRALGHFSSAWFAGGARGFGEVPHGDYLQTTYRIWLFGHQLGGGHAPWIDPYSFQPESPHQVGLGGWPFGLLLWPVYALASPVVAWNVFTLVALALGGLAACWWLRELRVARGAALVGALAFELAPYRVEQSTGHLLGPISVLLPVALACFERGLRRSRWWHAGAAAALVSIPLSGQVHLALGAVPFFALYAICRTRERRDLLGAAGAVVLGVAGGLLIQRGVIAKSVVAGGRDFHALTQYSAWPIDLVSRRQRHGSEQFVFLGWATVAAAVCGLVLLVRERRRGLAVALGVGAVLPVAAALGSHFSGYRFLWHHLGVLRYARVPERTLPIACLCLAALLALAVEWAARVRPRLGVWVVAAALLVVAVDLHVSVIRATGVEPHASASSVLRTQPRGAVLELPVTLPSDDLGSVYLRDSMDQRRPRPLGYSTVARPVADRTARALWPLNCGVVRPAAAALVGRLGVRFVELHRGLFHARGHEGLIRAARIGLRRMGFVQIARSGPIELWRLDSEPRPVAAAATRACRRWQQNAL